MANRKIESPNVGFVRDELAELLPKYNRIRDVLGGQDAVKKQGSVYLPRPDPTDRSLENMARYDGYKERAIFFNACRNTLEGLVGQVFIRPPVLKYPKAMEKVIRNATGNGVSVNLLSKKAMKYNVGYARSGVFVDYPMTEPGVGATIADVESGRIRPTINVVAPEKIINWSTRDIGAEEVLSLVVIAEQAGVHNDGFERSYNEQWRVLGLDKEGFYYQELWQEVTKRHSFSRKQYEMVMERFYPRGADGQLMHYIPFQFIGAENNDCNPDVPAFDDLAILNIGHYRNSADFEESVFVSGQPTVVIIGADDQWRKDTGGVARLGSVGGISVPMGGDVKLIQSTPNLVSRQAMLDKQALMIAIGARLVQERSVQRTATEASLESASESSILASMATNVGEAIENALKWAAAFMGLNTEEVEFKLNTDFDVAKMKPEDRRQLMLEWQGGLLTFEETREVLRKAGVAFEENDVAQAKINASMGELGGLSDDTI